MNAQYFLCIDGIDYIATQIGMGLPKIFRVIDTVFVHDVMIAQKADELIGKHLEKNPISRVKDSEFALEDHTLVKWSPDKQVPPNTLH